MADPVTESFPYGFCPKCGCYGKTRERRPNGDDTCVLGHKYPSRDALPTRSTDLRTLVTQHIARFEVTRREMRQSTDENDAGYARALEWVIDELLQVLRDAKPSETVNYVAIDATTGKPLVDEREQRLQRLEVEVRRLNNSLRHMREVMRRASMETT